MSAANLGVPGIVVVGYVSCSAFWAKATFQFQILDKQGILVVLVPSKILFIFVYNQLVRVARFRRYGQNLRSKRADYKRKGLTNGHE